MPTLTKLNAQYFQQFLKKYANFCLDLNPVDHHIWSVLEQRVYHTRIRDINHLVTRLVEEWQTFDLRIIDWAIKQWHPRLRLCVENKEDTLNISCSVA